MYWSSCNNQAFINGNNKEAEDVLKDESLIPFYVNSNIVYDESSQYADLILPDVTYLDAEQSPSVRTKARPSLASTRRISATLGRPPMATDRVPFHADATTANTFPWWRIGLPE